MFFKIYQNKYCRHANEKILFWKKYSQMTEFCKFPRDISCHDIDNLVKIMEERFTKYFWWCYRKGRQFPIFGKNILDLNLLVLETDLKAATTSKKNRERLHTPLNY